MNVAILTFDGFNPLDSFIAQGILGRVRRPDWQVALTCPTARVTSMHGVTVDAQRPLEFANEADVVLVGSGIKTRDIAADGALLSRLRLDPARQLIGAQCSGTLLLAAMGLLNGVPACTDLTTRPWVVESGVEVIDRPFHARDSVATAGGCLASQYLAFWVIARLFGIEEARTALEYAAPVGERARYVEHATAVVSPFLDKRAPALGEVS